MRSIEKAMNAAINLGQDWYKDNTRVAINDNSAWVYLHSNHIATVNRQSGEVVVNRDTFRKWPTNVTKSRLKALGVDVYVKQGTPYINGEEA